MKSVLYVGMDVHLAHTNLCLLNQHGKVLQQWKVKGHWRIAVERLRKLKRRLHVAFEASCGYGALNDLLTPFCERVVVAHPGQLRLIFRSKKKHDRVDAEKLAKLLFLNELPVVHVPAPEIRAWRQMIEYRSQLVVKRTRVKNSLRGLLRSQGIAAPRGNGLWTRKGLAWLSGLELPAFYDLRRDMSLDELRDLEKRIGRVEKQLQVMADLQPGVALLRGIPGVGPRTAEAIVAYIDSPARFGNARQVGSYFGLVPSQDQSGKTNRLGRITREGPAIVRRLVTEAAWQGLRRSARLRRFYEQVRQGNPERNKIALVATAHFLVRVSWAMLRRGTAWQELAS